MCRSSASPLTSVFCRTPWLASNNSPPNRTLASSVVPLPLPPLLLLLLLPLLPLLVVLVVVLRPRLGAVFCDRRGRMEKANGGGVRLQRATKKRPRTTTTTTT